MDIFHPLIGNVETRWAEFYLVFCILAILAFLATIHFTKSLRWQAWFNHNTWGRSERPTLWTRLDFNEGADFFNLATTALRAFKTVQFQQIWRPSHSWFRRSWRTCGKLWRWPRSRLDRGQVIFTTPTQIRVFVSTIGITIVIEDDIFTNQVLVWESLDWTATATSPQTYFRTMSQHAWTIFQHSSCRRHLPDILVNHRYFNVWKSFGPADDKLTTVDPVFLWSTKIFALAFDKPSLKSENALTRIVYRALSLPPLFLDGSGIFVFHSQTFLWASPRDWGHNVRLHHASAPQPSLSRNPCVVRLK